MGLATYARKRDFTSTPEPARGGRRGGRIFVVQLHHASRRHFDFRLELDGVLKSWAVPKGPSFDPAVKRLAMEVEDHPIAYATFEGDIPKGHYGAGHVDVFDSGTWEAIGDARKGLAAGELKFMLHGDVLRGSWVLVRTRKQGSQQQWLLIKHDDAYAGDRDVNAFVDPKTDRPIALTRRRKVWAGHAAANPDTPAAAASAGEPARGRRAAMRVPFAPELCRPVATAPTGAAWLHEVKWDGYRILATVERGKARLWSRNAIEWTAKVPELARAIESFGFRNAQLDGEMVVLHGERESFNALQSRLAAETREPAIYMLFDLLHADGRSLWEVPLIERKRLLDQRLAAHPHPLLRYSEHQVGGGAAVFAQAIEHGLEGIVSKRIDSAYTGTRSGAWVKVKARRSDEFAIVGYTEPKGRRAGIGALLLAAPGGNGALRYVGRVGTGFSDDELRQLRRQLARSTVDEPPADVELMAASDRRLAIWVRPRLVAEVYYQGYGGQGLLRQVAFKTIRADKTVEDLMKTTASPDRKRPARGAGSTPRRRAAADAKASAAKQAGAASVTITHPDRVVFPEAGITKGEVAEYYRQVAPWLLPELSGRPVSVVRCPDGIAKACFFQKHAGRGWGEHVHAITVQEKNGSDEYLCIDDVEGLLELVQMNVLEFHPWGSPSGDPDHASRVVFDMDPGKGVTWKRVVAAAREVRKQLETVGLTAFVRTSGGKGLHVVVPLDPPAPWDAVRRFAQGVAQALSALHPDDFVATAGEKNRNGKIFVDWLRNGRGATSVASYSLRARPSVGVAMPLGWNELGRVKSGDAFTIANALARLKRRRTDPWAAMADTHQSLPDLD
ncbi:MAG TPA: DNA ligase D [Dokdonella sp.]|uniref:DNA ligase D n=1 Tax=Dokdonella sp. TaxID=2291710 RepID=UPI002C07FD36|nr:DNA ligase D [Dokdonella sp.]HUD40799.1 DNA ligase D [Dokdonella sp.]